MWTSLADSKEGPGSTDAALAEALAQLPLFPLPNVVLFPHALLPLLRYGHGVPLIAGVVMVVLLVCFAFFKLSQLRPSRHRL